jgi:hypothetical protein
MKEGRGPLILAPFKFIDSEFRNVGVGFHGTSRSPNSEALLWFSPGT